MLDYTRMKKDIHLETDMEAAMKVAELTKPQLLNLIDGLEEWWKTNIASAQKVCENKAGISVSKTLAEKIAKVWLKEKGRSA